MKKTLLLVLATAFTTTTANALSLKVETFISHKATLTEGSQTEGTDVDRFRLFLVHKFDKQWSFNGRFEFKADGLNKVYLPEANFMGKDVLMDGDTIKFGIQDNPAFAIENSMGNRWITKPIVDDEGFAVTGTQSGFSYGVKFGALGATLFTLSGEAGDAKDTDDNNKLNGVMIDYKIGEGLTAWMQQASINTNAGGTTTATTTVPVAGTVSATTITSAGVNYKSEMVDAGFNYHMSTYKVSAGEAPKSNTALGVNSLFKKLMGPTNLYFHYWTGYDKFADTGEITQAKTMLGPTWNFANNKVSLGVFYEMETLQAEYKASAPSAKDPAAMYLKMAAKF